MKRHHGVEASTSDDKEAVSQNTDPSWLEPWQDYDQKTTANASPRC